MMLTGVFLSVKKALSGSIIISVQRDLPDQRVRRSFCIAKAAERTD